MTPAPAPLPYPRHGHGVIVYALSGFIALLTIIAPGVAGMGLPDATATGGLRQAVLAGALIAIGLFTCALGISVRGDFFGIFAAGRNRYSLSRFQMALWSWLILAALAAATICRAWGLGGAPAGAALVIHIDTNLLAIMGISYFTGAAAPGLLALKSNSNGAPATALAARSDGQLLGVTGQIVYRPAAFAPRFADLVLGDEASNAGSIDLSKLQQLLITIILVGAYATLLFQMFGGPDFVVRSGSDHGTTLLPPLSGGIVQLLLLSHAGYLGYNAVSKPPAAAGLTLLNAGPPSTPARADEP